MKTSAIYTKYLRFFFLRGLFCFIISIGLVFTSLDAFAVEENPPFSHYEVIEERNIFKLAPDTDDAEEKPKVVKDNKEIKEVLEVGGYILTGVISIRGKYKAIVADAKNKEGFYVNVGDSVGKYTVEDIQKDTVVLSKKGKKFNLTLENKAPGSSKKKAVAESVDSTVAPVENELIDPDESYKSQIMQSIRTGVPNFER